MRTLLALPLVLLFAAPALAAPDLSGSYDLLGADSIGRYRGRVTLTQTAQGRVSGQLTIEYVRWSWSARSYVPTGRHNAASIAGRVSGSELRGTRRAHAGLAGLLGGGAPATSAIRYRIYERAGKVSAIRGSFAGSAWEQLHGHRPVVSTRDQDLHRLRTTLEAATSGMLWMSESDYPFTWVQLDGAAAGATSVAGFRTALGVEATRPAEERALAATFGWRLQHQPGETPEEAAEVERYVRLKALLESNLTDVRVYRVAEPGRDGLFGAIDVYIVGRNAHGDLVGLRTVSVET
jgi:hypothetical protein